MWVGVGVDLWEGKIKILPEHDFRKSTQSQLSHGGSYIGVLERVISK